MIVDGRRPWVLTLFYNCPAAPPPPVPFQAPALNSPPALRYSSLPFTHEGEWQVSSHPISRSRTTTGLRPPLGPMDLPTHLLPPLAPLQ